MSTPTNPAEAIQMAKDHNVEYADMRFTDVPGLQHHFSLPIGHMTEDVFSEGLGFDGSSVRGFQTIDASDMLLLPDPTTAIIDPFNKHTTIAMVCDVVDPVTGELYDKDPRGVAKRAKNYLTSTGIADHIYVGPELEFFIFDQVSYTNHPQAAGFSLESHEGVWSSGEEEPNGINNSGHKIPHKMGYFPLSPMDTFQDLRSDMASVLMDCGIAVELHHHEVGTAGQAEIDIVFGDMLEVADSVQTYKYVIRNVAKNAGYTATFMPKPIYADNGSGMHTHQSLWRGDEPLFFDENGYAGLSDIARYYVGGLLRHANTVLAFAAATTNSYKRLVPGYEAPVNLAYSSRNRSAAIRVPLYSNSPKAKRLEFRCPDPSANPYLAFAAMLMAGIDGIQNRIDPGEPLDKNIYQLTPEEAAGVPTVPGSLAEALDALESDHDFLLAGGVFTRDLLESYVEVKREEVDAVNLRPHPMEFELYYSV